MKMDPDFSQTIVAAHLIESTIMDLGDEIQNLKAFQLFAQIGNLVLLLLWYFVHFVISLWYFASSLSQIVENYLISSGYLEKYKTLDSSRVRYLAIVLDSEEARRTSEVIVLLRHLTEIGVKNVCLYDAQGLLKKSKEVLVEKLSYAKLFEEANNSNTLLDKNYITLEFASSSDGKEAVAKAANYLFKQNYLDGDQKELTFKESDIDEALKVIGCGQPDPDLLLVYGPARCHLGFPAWRIRYTEIVYMGPLKSMKYGSLIKAIHKFTKVQQNYGT